MAVPGFDKFAGSEFEQPKAGPKGEGQDARSNVHFHMLMLDGVYEPVAARPESRRLGSRRLGWKPQTWTPCFRGRRLQRLGVRNSPRIRIQFSCTIHLPVALRISMEATEFAAQLRAWAAGDTEATDLAGRQRCARAGRNQRTTTPGRGRPTHLILVSGSR